MSDPASENKDPEVTLADDSDDRREFYRVTTLVEMDIQQSSPEEEDSTKDDVNEIAFANDSLYFKFLTAMRALDANDSQIAYDLKQDDGELYRYLQTMNRKIELLARMVLNPENRPPQEANMSSSGLGFISSESFSPGSVVKVRIIFPQNYDVVYAFGHIVHCAEFMAEDGSKQHWIGLKFSKISETNKRIMTRQVFKTQSEDLREARQKQAQEESEQNESPTDSD
jgi:hypothetical protein